ncbi:NADH:ubiquinone oxidoreductase [Orbilia javanica]|uniref:NADH:ubiquinone oxidoreductase n=1 Tax=Orbilia javanica TaxID=47235 RepID=A0AAN8RPH9_9PEZI
MMAAADLASPQKPDWLSPSEEVEWYKSQYASLEQELLEFQTFSKELETELERELKTLEKEVEGHERNTDNLRKKNEGLKYEVDEWKTKFKASKEEANHVQNQLQKEITELREKNRTAQIRIREMEVSNDDFERNERIVKSSLDDLEYKYNVAIERNVMNESEIQMLEQEREELRIEVQRFKDELAELKVEAELSEEKYRMARRGTSNPRFQSPMPDAPTTPTSVSPTPRLSRATPSADFSSPTPPSPPISESSTSGSRIPTPHKDHLMTPKASHYRRGLPKGTPKKTPSMANLSDSARKKLIGNAAVAAKTSNIPGPNSKSLTQIRGLIGQMQRLEKRVQTARSKMPPPTAKTPPRRMSPHLGSSAFLPPTSINMNLRRNIKRPGSTTSSVTSTSIDERFGSLTRSFAGQITEAISRTETPSSRPSSRTSSRQSYSTAGQGISRPSSRASTSNISHIPLPEYSSLPVPKSRTSLGGLNDDIFTTPRRGLTRAESGTHSRAVSTSGGSAIPRRKSDKNVPPVPPMPPMMRRKKLSGVGDA